MKILITKKIGNDTYTFEVEKDKEVDALSIAGFLASMPTKCKICGSENVHLTSNKAQGFTFIKVICEDCNARSQLGQYKDGGFFWKRWEKYQPPQTGFSEEEPPIVEDSTENS